MLGQDPVTFWSPPVNGLQGFPPVMHALQFVCPEQVPFPAESPPAVCSILTCFHVLSVPQAKATLRVPVLHLLVELTSENVTQRSFLKAVAAILRVSDCPELPHRPDPGSGRQVHAQSRDSMQFILADPGLFFPP